MRDELRTERAEREKRKQKARVFGLRADAEDSEEGDEDARTLSGMRRIKGVEKLRAAYRRHPAAFSKNIEEKTVRVLDEYPGEAGATPAAMLAVRYVTTFMPMGTQQAVGRLCIEKPRTWLAATTEFLVLEQFDAYTIIYDHKPVAVEIKSSLMPCAVLNYPEA